MSFVGVENGGMGHVYVILLSKLGSLNFSVVTCPNPPHPTPDLDLRMIAKNKGNV